MSVYQVGKTWYVDFTQRGIRVKKAIPEATTRKQALAAEKKERKVPRTQTARSTLTLTQAITRVYKERWSKLKDGEHTFNTTIKIVKILGDIPLSSLDERQLNRLVVALQERGLSPASINRYRSHLRTVLNVAQREWKEIQSVPYIRNTREVLKRFKVYSREEERMILEAASPNLRRLLIVLVDTGCRLGEAVRLKPDDLDWEHGMVRIWENKGDRPRSVPMTTRVKEALREGYTFADTYEVERRWKELRKKLGKDGDPEWVLHAFRHTCASRLVQAGVDLYSVKELLGHSTIKVTERYAHLSPAKLQKAIQTLEEASNDRVDAVGCGDSGG